MTKQFTLSFVYVVMFFNIISVQAQITVNAIPSRINGVAPLSVFFDASTSKHDSIAISPLHDLYYKWDFDDSKAGFWVRKNVDQNEAKGAMVGHVFTRPGEYNVTVVVTDHWGNKNSATIPIVVQNPRKVYKGENTICFSTTGDFKGSPKGALKITISDSALYEIQPYISSNKRLLFHRADTIKSPLGLIIEDTKNLTIGAFGVRKNGKNERLDNLPTFIITGEGQDAITISSEDTAYRTDDIRIMDLRLINNLEKNIGKGIVAAGSSNDNLLFRLEIGGFSTAIDYSYTNLNELNKTIYRGHELYQQLTIAKCHLYDAKEMGDLANVSAKRLVVMGNEMENSQEGRNILCTPWIQKGIINHNKLMYPSKEHTCLKLHGPLWIMHDIAESQYTEKVIVADNYFEADKGVSQVVEIKRGTNNSEALRDIIFERNYVCSGENTGVQYGLVVAAEHTTVRNNIFNGTGSSKSYFTGIHVQTLLLSTITSNVKAYNNTIYKNDLTQLITGVKINKWVENAFVSNNLVYSPLARKLRITDDRGKNTYVNLNIAPDLIPFYRDEPMTANDFQLDSLSSMIDRGCNLGAVVTDDYNGVLRPYGSQCDVGAFEFIPVSLLALAGNTAKGAEDLKKYPNPAENYLTIDLAKIHGEYSIEIFNVNGQSLYTEHNLEEKEYTWFINDEFPDGIYWIKVSSRTGTFLTKVMVAR